MIFNFRKHTISGIRFGKFEFRLIALLYCAAPNPLSTAELIDGVYGDDSEGGPESASKAIHVHLHYLRRGTSRRGHNMHWCGYKLKELDLAIDRSFGQYWLTHLDGSPL